VANSETRNAAGELVYRLLYIGLPLPLRPCCVLPAFDTSFATSARAVGGGARSRQACGFCGIVNGRTRSALPCRFVGDDDLRSAFRRLFQRLGSGHSEGMMRLLLIAILMMTVLGAVSAIDNAAAQSGLGPAYPGAGPGYPGGTNPGYPGYPGNPGATNAYPTYPSAPAYQNDRVPYTPYPTVTPAFPSNPTQPPSR